MIPQSHRTLKDIYKFVKKMGRKGFLKRVLWHKKYELRILLLEKRLQDMLAVFQVSWRTSVSTMKLTRSQIRALVSLEELSHRQICEVERVQTTVVELGALVNQGFVENSAALERMDSRLSAKLGMKRVYEI